jgi:hypothetical protein
MAKNRVGYGRPPHASRFKPGISGNPKGRPKKEPHAASDIIESTMESMVEFQERGVRKSASRRELSIRALVSKAIKGDVKSAEMLLDLREHAERYGNKTAQRIIVTGWLPDFPHQTAEEKTRAAAQPKNVEMAKWWKKPDDDPEKSSD